MNTELKTCQDCRYFKRYYVKIRLRFVSLEYGECWVHKRKKIEVHPQDFACKKWETKEEEVQIRKELGAGVFQVVCERVDELIALLKE